MFSPTTSASSETFNPKVNNVAPPFFLNPKNADYAAGKRKSIASQWLSLAIVGLVLAAVAIAIAAYMFIDARQRDTLIATGEVARGTLTGGYYTTGSRSGNTYYMEYIYPLADDTELTGKQQISSSHYFALKTGERVEVRYDPKNPSDHVVVGKHADSTERDIFPIIAAGSSAIGVVLLAFAVFFNAREQRLHKGGKLITGELVNVVPQWYRGSLSLQAQYKFISPETGEVITRKHTTPRNDLRQRTNLIGWKIKDGVIPYPGTPVMVLYANPKNFRVL